MTSKSEKQYVIGDSVPSLMNAEAYFLTICTHGRQLTLGHVENGHMILNPRGKLVDEEWVRTATTSQNVQLDAYIVMPNHFHAIFWLADNVPVSEKSDSSPHPPDGTAEDANSAEDLIQSFKAAVTNRSQQLFNTPNTPFWQPSFHAHLVRQKKALPSLRKYVQDNPAGWTEDSLNPAVGDPSCPIDPPPMLG